MTRLDPAFLRVPLAHRGLHDRTKGVVENSRGAFEAAIAKGYGIELDVQGDAQAVPLVFHDADLDRLTGATGALRDREASDLTAIRLSDSTESIPTLADVLDLIAGRCPLLIEIKDQDGRLGPDVGELQNRVCDALSGYIGPVAVMSFNPHTIAAVKTRAPNLPIGLVTDAFSAADWPEVPPARRATLAGIPDAEDLGLDFISHNRRDLTSPAVSRLKSKGLPILCWTVRSKEQEMTARKTADNVTFEGYSAARPGVD